MPCTYYSDSELRDMDREALSHATRLLCKMVAHFGVIPGDAELEAWKTEHDEMDRKRAAAEETALARKAEADRLAKLAEQASAKLTAEELEALRGKR